MSDSGGGGGEPGRREVAYRLFAAEYDDADLSYSESDEERAPNYVVTPSGARVNRLFVVGVLTEVESVSEDYLRARVVDPTGPFVVYAGQYQPEAMRFLESAEPPTFVAVTGKARTFQPEDSDRVYTSVRPESINEVDADTRDRWVIQAAEGTLDRVARMAEAKDAGVEGDDLEASLAAHGVDEGLASGIPIALDHYGTTGEYLDTLRQVALDALRVVAGERDEVAAELPDPDHGGDGALLSLVEESVEPVTADVPEEPDEVEPEPAGVDADAETTAATDAPDEPETTEASDEPAATEETAEPQVAAAEGSGAVETEPADDQGVESDAEAEPAEESASEPEAEIDSESGAEAETSGEATDASGDELGDFEGDFDLDEEEREEIESEYGTEFKSGTEVEEPGEADIDTPDPEEVADVDEAAVPDEDVVEDDASEAEAFDDDADGDEPTGAAAIAEEEAADAEEDTDAEISDEDEEFDESASEVALDDAVVDAMVDLDDGDGADRDAVIGEVVDATGADPGDVEEAIQDALMDGLCYEPDDGTLKPI